MNTDPRLLVAAALAGIAVTAGIFAVFPPRRRLSVRVTPYAHQARSSLGTSLGVVAVIDSDRPVRHPFVEVFGPLVRRCADLLAGIVDASSRETAELRLRQAGMTGTVEQYRIRQLGYTLAGITGGIAVGLLLRRSTGVVLLLGGLVGFPAATYWRSRVRRTITERAVRMRLELSTICQVLAVYLRTGHGPVEAVTLVTRRARGPVADELAEALGWITAGLQPQAAYGRLATVTPEPAAARLYRTLAASSGTTSDISDSLLVLADDIRSERREELARHAIKRRTAMLLPLLTLIAPVMLLFVAAALPSIVFGR